MGLKRIARVASVVTAPYLHLYPAAQNIMTPCQRNISLPISNLPPTVFGHSDGIILRGECQEDRKIRMSSKISCRT